MSWLLGLFAEFLSTSAVKLVSASALISMITAIFGFVFNKEKKQTKVVITAGGKKVEYSDVSSEELEKVVQDLNEEHRKPRKQRKPLK